MTLEEALSAIQKLQEAWIQIAQTVTDFADALNKIFQELSEDDTIWPERNGISPKKYGMSLHKRVRTGTPCYRFIPVAPRNRPYQRRAY